MLSKVEQVHKHFLRRLLGVPANTCDKFLYAEFGRVPLQQFWWKQCCLYSSRLLKLDDKRPCKQAFLLQSRCNLAWIKGVTSRCEDLHIRPPHPVTESQSSAAEDAFDAAAAAEANAAALAASIMTPTADSRKQATYFSIKKDNACEPYITQAKNHHLRRIIALFRTGSHWLRVQSGRFERLEFSQRTCPACQGEVEDEQHAVFACPIYDELRSKYADLFTHASNLQEFLQQSSVHRVGLFLTECRALRMKERLVSQTPSAIVLQNGR